MSLLYVILLFILITIDCITECTLTCKCGKKFTNTFIGACFTFDYHYIKDHLINWNKQ